MEGVVTMDVYAQMDNVIVRMVIVVPKVNTVVVVANIITDIVVHYHLVEVQVQPTQKTEYAVKIMERLFAHQVNVVIKMVIVVPLLIIAIYQRNVSIR